MTAALRNSPDVIVLLPAEGRTAAVLSDLRIGADVQRPAHVGDVEQSRQRFDATPAQAAGIRVTIRITIHPDRDEELASRRDHARKAGTWRDTCASGSGVTIALEWQGPLLRPRRMAPNGVGLFGPRKKEPPVGGSSLHIIRLKGG